MNNKPRRKQRNYITRKRIKKRKRRNSSHNIMLTKKMTQLSFEVIKRVLKKLKIISNITNDNKIQNQSIIIIINNSSTIQVLISNKIVYRRWIRVTWQSSTRLHPYRTETNSVNKIVSTIITNKYHNMAIKTLKDIIKQWIISMECTTITIIWCINSKLIIKTSSNHTNSSIRITSNTEWNSSNNNITRTTTFMIISIIISEVAKV